MDTATRLELSQQSDLVSTLAWLNVNGQLVLPESLLADFPEAKLFTAAVADGRIVLTPLPTSPAAAADLRRQLAEQGVTETDVKDAIAWARGS